MSGRKIIKPLTAVFMALIIIIGVAPFSFLAHGKTLLL